MAAPARTLLASVRCLVGCSFRLFCPALPRLAFLCFAEGPSYKIGKKTGEAGAVVGAAGALSCWVFRTNMEKRDKIWNLVQFILPL